MEKPDKKEKSRSGKKKPALPKPSFSKVLGTPGALRVSHDAVAKAGVHRSVSFSSAVSVFMDGCESTVGLGQSVAGADTLDISSSSGLDSRPNPDALTDATILELTQDDDVSSLQGEVGCSCAGLNCPHLALERAQESP